MSAPLSSYIPGFLAARRYAPASRKQRMFICRQFCTTIGDPSPEDLTTAMCLDWWVQHEDRAPATASAYLKAVRQFLTHLRDIGVMPADDDQLRAIRPPTARRRAPGILTVDEVQAVWNACKGTRDRCIVALMLGCGLRSVDVAGIRVENIDLDERVMVVLGKGGHQDLLPIPTDVATAITDYLAEQPAASGPLIRSMSDRRPLDPRGVQDRVRHLIRQAGVKREALDGRGGHALRRTFASALLDSGASVRDVQTLLRHQSLATTESYLRRPEAREMRSLVEHSPLSHVTATMTPTTTEETP